MTTIHAKKMIITFDAPLQDCASIKKRWKQIIEYTKKSQNHHLVDCSLEIIIGPSSNKSHLS
jgi:hypothetical protein